MITFPPEFTAIRYPGYFWNTTEQRLYSIKIAGILRPLALSKANKFNRGVAGYKISVNGRKRYVAEITLRRIKSRDSVIPVQLSLF